MKLWKFVLAVALIGLITFAGAYHHFNRVQSAYESGFLDGKEAGYELGYAEGNQSGYELGYWRGYEDGNASGYEVGYAKGKRSGYEAGYAVGYSEGNATAFEAGYESGYGVGNRTGYESGYDVGYQEGNRTGYEVGYELGYGSGYLQGVIDGAGRGYTIRDPTYQEVLIFISEDKTDENEYIPGKYTCLNFAADFKNNAFQAGYRCGFVEIEFPEAAHAIVCFNTTDQGLIFIEPQTDEIVTLSVGEFYWDRIVVRFVIIW